MWATTSSSGTSAFQAAPLGHLVSFRGDGQGTGFTSSWPRGRGSSWPIAPWMKGASFTECLEIFFAERIREGTAEKPAAVVLQRDMHDAREQGPQDAFVPAVQVHGQDGTSLKAPR